MINMNRPRCTTCGAFKADIRCVMCGCTRPSWVADIADTQPIQADGPTCATALKSVDMGSQIVENEWHED